MRGAPVSASATGGGSSWVGPGRGAGGAAVRLGAAPLAVAAAADGADGTAGSRFGDGDSGARASGPGSSITRTWWGPPAMNAANVPAHAPMTIAVVVPRALDMNSGAMIAQQRRPRLC